MRRWWRWRRCSPRLPCAGNEPEDERGAGGPEGGAEPVGGDEAGVGFGVEAVGESGVEGHLDESGGGPEGADGGEAGPAPGVLGVGGDEGEGGEEFGEHRRADGEGG